MGYPRTKKANAGDIVQYLEQDYNDSTIRFVVCYPGRIASDVLRSAVKKVVEVVDILHASCPHPGLKIKCDFTLRRRGERARGPAEKSPACQLL